MTEEKTAAALWHFALEFYARPGVSAALLRLQDEAGLDVPLLLALLYAKSHHIGLDNNTLAALARTAARWQSEIIAPLRDVRRGLKAEVPENENGRVALREQVKAAELEAERLSLGALGVLLGELAPARPGDLNAYLEVIAKTLRADQAAALSFLINAAR